MNINSSLTIPCDALAATIQRSLDSINSAFERERVTLQQSVQSRETAAEDAYSQFKRRFDEGGLFDAVTVSSVYIPPLHEWFMQWIENVFGNGQALRVLVLKELHNITVTVNGAQFQLRSTTYSAFGDAPSWQLLTTLNDVWTALDDSSSPPVFRKQLHVWVVAPSNSGNSVVRVSSQLHQLSTQLNELLHTVTTLDGNSNITICIDSYTEMLNVCNEDYITRHYTVTRFTKI